MANTGLTSAQMLPRFLLPKLSWQAGSTSQHAARPMSSMVASRSPLERRPRTATEAPQKRIPSQVLNQLSSRRTFSATARQARDHHFDTLKFVQRLKEEGFTEAQSVAMMKVLSDVIEERYVVLENDCCLY